MAATNDSSSLRGKSALVTGATRGIGRAIAFELARAGASVVVNSRKPDAVDETVHAIRAEGGCAEGVPAHVGRVDEARTLVDRAADLLGGLDIVVNNAGINPVFGAIEITSDEAFDKIIAVNLKAPFEIAKRALPLLRARGGGAILNVSSMAGIAPEPMLGIYSVSKAALISLTRVMARDWGPSNIRVNAICPGLVKTDFSAALWQDDAIRTRILRRQGLQRLGTPEEVASLAAYLVSDAAGFCTGGIYTVDGGYTA